MTALLAALALAAPVSVLAAPMTLSSPTSLSGSSTLAAQPFNKTGAGVTATGTAEITLHWSQPATLGTAFDSNLVRQGRSLDPADSYTRTPTGVMSIDYTLDNLQVSWDGIGPLNLGSPTYTTSGTCDLKAGGTDYVCHLTSGSSVELFPPPPGVIFGYIGPYVDLGLESDVTITPAGIDTLRSADAGSVSIGTANLSLLESPITDSLSIPCTIAAGDNLTYTLGGLSTTDGVSVDSSLVFEVGAAFPDPIIPFLEHKVAFASPSIDLGTTTGDVTETGAGAVFDMGPIQKNNTPPGADAGGPYSGAEGTAIHFDGSGTTSVCGIDSLAFRWDFSDGGVAFGKQPFHTFQDNGIFSGQLTATDPTGLSNTVNFSVTVSNQNPVANAGPDTTADWGRFVAFNGQATDPGADDQATLQYSWDFGDGSPSSTGGPSVLHAYAAPGDYGATLTVTDKDGGSDSDTRTVHVTKRDTVASYVGASNGTYDTAGQLTASLVDEYGVNLNGKSIDFTVNGSPAGSGSTNSSGIASIGYTPLLDAGGYGTQATFAGDGLYNGSNGAGSIAIARKATSVSYTGALSGGPNKTIVLSAILADATGTRLGGRSIVFQLGSQTATATTDANGVASVSLKLAQKNGTYPLTATFTPGGADAVHYLGSGDAKTFKLQAK